MNPAPMSISLQVAATGPAGAPLYCRLRNCRWSARPAPAVRVITLCAIAAFGLAARAQNPGPPNEPMQIWLFPQGRNCVPYVDPEEEERAPNTAHIDWQADPATATGESPLTRAEIRAMEYLRRLRIPFPDGACVRLLPDSTDLLMRNTLENLKKTEHLMGLLNARRGASSVEISAQFLRIPADTAADWGLDGGPALKPDTNPLGKPIPAILNDKDARTVVAALRALPGTDVLGAARCLTLSGNTAISRTVVEKQLLVEDEPRDLGIILEVTPTVASDGRFIDLELRPQCVVLDQREPRTPQGEKWQESVAVLSVETKILLSDGDTAVVAAGVPAPLTLPEPENQDRRPVLILVTARLMHTTDRAHIVIEEAE